MTTVETISEIIEYLDSFDCMPTKENVEKTLRKWIGNLRSQIGEEAHLHRLACGVIDETGMSWEEQDVLRLQQIQHYKECLMKL